MKNWFYKLVLGLVLTALLTGPARAQQARLATIDMKKVFENYWKRKQLQTQIDARIADMRKDEKNMMDDYKKANEQYQTLLASATDSNASPEERDKRKKTAEEKFKDLKQMEDDFRSYDSTTKSRLGEQSDRYRERIIGEIRTVVTAKAKAAGFSLVLDTAAQSHDLTPVVLFSNNENDMTEDVLRTLNASAPTETTKADDTPASSTDSKKPNK